jgi:hypothetical protein
MVKILFAIKMWPWQQSLGRSLPTTVSTHSMPTPPPPPARLCPTTISIHWGTLSSGTSNCTTPTTSRRSCSGTSFSPRQRTYDDDELLNVELYGDAEASDEDRDIRRAMAAGSLIVPRIDDVTPAVLMSDESRGGGVPAIAGLRREKYDGSSGGDTSCVICMRDYKKGKRLLALPCPHGHIGSTASASGSGWRGATCARSAGTRCPPWTTRQTS